MKIGHSSQVCPSAAGALWRVALSHHCVYPKIFSYDLCMLYPSTLRLAASITTTLVAPTHSLQLLAYVYFTVVTTIHLLEASTYHHVLSHKAIY